MMVICFSVRLLLNKGKICRRFARYSIHSSPIMIKQQQVLPSKPLLNRSHMSTRRQEQQGTFDLQRRDVKLQIAGEEKEKAHVPCYTQLWGQHNMHQGCIQHS